MPVISVIMLTYNREKLVHKAIESILGQTFRDFEFIIVDNGSTDNSGKIADQYALQDGRIKVIHRTQGNIGAGRNTGLDAACGEYIAFIDDDDWAEPDFLAFLYHLAVDNQADIAICGAADKAFDEKRIMTAQEALVELMWRKRYNMAFPTKLIHYSLMQDLRFPESGKYDDIALMYKMLAKSRRVAYHGLPKYTFYRHPGNNSAWTTNHELLTAETLQEYLEVYQERTDLLRSLFPDNADTWEYFKWSFMISMVEKVSSLQLQDCYILRDKMAEELRIHKKAFLNSPHICDFETEWMAKYITQEPLVLGKFTLIITTRCNLRCKLCCEYVPLNKPFPDMTIEQCKKILHAFFSTVDYVKTLHLSGGGEPFLHQNLAELVAACMEYKEQFEKLMLFTNCTVVPSNALLTAMHNNRDKIIVQVSRYGIYPEKEVQVLAALEPTGVKLKIEKYYGENQSFGGWVDFGAWEKYGRPEDEMQQIFKNCAITRDMKGNWRTRDGKTHWCSRSQRGMELGLLPDDSHDYVDLLDDSTCQEKREKFRAISQAHYLHACDYCSGDQGTCNVQKRYPAAEQL